MKINARSRAPKQLINGMANLIVEANGRYGHSLDIWTQVDEAWWRIECCKCSGGVTARVMQHGYPPVEIKGWTILIQSKVCLNGSRP